MTAHPWDLIGWIILAAMIASVIVTPIAVVLMLHARRKIARQITERHREIFEGLRRGGRFKP